MAACKVTGTLADLLGHARAAEIQAPHLHRRLLADLDWLAGLSRGQSGLPAALIWVDPIDAAVPGPRMARGDRVRLAAHGLIAHRLPDWETAPAPGAAFDLAGVAEPVSQVSGPEGFTVGYDDERVGYVLAVAGRQRLTAPLDGSAEDRIQEPATLHLVPCLQGLVPAPHRSEGLAATARRLAHTGLVLVEVRLSAAAEGRPGP